MLALAWLTSRRQETRPIAFGILWFFIALLPTSSLVPLSEPMNDHRMFFPFVGLILAVVWGSGWRSRSATSVRERSQRSRSPPVAVMLAMAYGTRQRNIVWHTEESLWLDTTIKSPDNGRGLMNYGVIQMNKGNLAVANDYFSARCRSRPNYAYLHVNSGVLKARARTAAPRPSVSSGKRSSDDPNNPVSYTYFARWLQSVGRTEEARLFADAAVRLSPADADARAAARRAERVAALSAGDQRCVAALERALVERLDHAFERLRLDADVAAERMLQRRDQDQAEHDQRGQRAGDP